MHSTFGPTPTQRDCLLVVQELTALDGVAPTLDEIQRELGHPNRSNVHWLLCRLKERGWVDWVPAKARSIVVLRSVPMPDEPVIVGLFSAPELAARIAGETVIPVHPRPLPSEAAQP